ncbi:MAG: hypothetical protein OEZ06_20295 [Myxococcales bacterium]|nr:hypothetical protein [Myxococcales bacterium]
MDTMDIMDNSKLTLGIQIHGADLSRWPEPLAEQARAWLRKNEGARHILAEAQAFEALLDQAPGHRPSPALRRAVAEIPLRHPPETATPRLPFFLASLLRGALSAAFVLLVGITAGWLSAGQDADTAPSQPVTILAAPSAQAAAEPSVEGAELEALMQLAFADELQAELEP